MSRLQIFSGSVRRETASATRSSIDLVWSHHGCFAYGPLLSCGRAAPPLFQRDPSIAEELVNTVQDARVQEFALTKQGLTSGFPQPPAPSHGPLPPRRASTAATRARSTAPFIIAALGVFRRAFLETGGPLPTSPDLSRWRASRSGAGLGVKSCNPACAAHADGRAGTSSPWFLHIDG